MAIVITEIQAATVSQVIKYKDWRLIIDFLIKHSKPFHLLHCYIVEPLNIKQSISQYFDCATNPHLIKNSRILNFIQFC